MDRPNLDLGRFHVTNDPLDIGKFKTPTLRNVELTAPYMHDGSLETLEDVVNFYDKGGVPNPTLDPGIRRLRLAREEKTQLVEFLKTLTGDRRREK
jgi:cytochrome c peroxidase